MLCGNCKHCEIEFDIIGDIWYYKTYCELFVMYIADINAIGCDDWKERFSDEEDLKW